MKHVPNGVSAKRWKQIKAIAVPEPRMVHQSAAVAMIPHPTDPLMPPTPWIERPGNTFNKGRNKAKREARA